MDAPLPPHWHSRGFLPHFDAPGQIQALTFRLGDSMPSSVVARWKLELSSSSDDTELRKRISRYEDAGHGSCLLRDDANASLVESCLLYADGQRYRLLEWCIMPNHVHALIAPLGDCSLGEIIRTWKTFSAREINKLRQSSGSVWAPDFHDRYIRDQKHYDAARSYIRQNPVKAGLCCAPDDWRWSSAYHGRRVQ